MKKSSKNRVFYIIALTGLISVNMMAATPDWKVAIKATKNSDYFKSIAVIDDDTVYAITNSSKIFKTTDRGQTWTTSAISFWQKGTQPRAVSFANAKVGYIAGDNSIIKTTDYGKTWTKLTDPGVDMISSVYAISADTCYFGAKGAVLYTYDGGKTISSTSVSAGLSSLCVTNDGSIYRGGSDGGIYKSVNNAQSFKVASNKNTTSYIDNQISGIYFSDNNTGYVAGLKKSGESPFVNNLLKTTDGGKTWKGISLGITSALNTKGPLGVFIPSKGIGYVVGLIPNEGEIYILRTTDSGATFTSDTAGALLTDYYAVSITPCGDVYVAGNGCLLYRQAGKK